MAPHGFFPYAAVTALCGQGLRPVLCWSGWFLYTACMEEQAKHDSLPEYQCHKVVRAAKIVKVEQYAPNTVVTYRLHLNWGGARCNTVVTVDHTWNNKHQPNRGGYFVVYADGYTSYSPAGAFEDGYALLNPAEKELAMVHDMNEPVTALSVDRDKALLRVVVEESLREMDIRDIPRINSKLDGLMRFVQERLRSGEVTKIHEKLDGLERMILETRNDIGSFRANSGNEQCLHAKLDQLLSVQYFWTGDHADTTKAMEVHSMLRTLVMQLKSQTIPRSDISHLSDLLRKDLHGRGVALGFTNSDIESWRELLMRGCVHDVIDILGNLVDKDPVEPMLVPLILENHKMVEGKVFLAARVKKDGHGTIPIRLARKVPVDLLKQPPREVIVMPEKPAEEQIFGTVVLTEAKAKELYNWPLSIDVDGAQAWVELFAHELAQIRIETKHLNETMKDAFLEPIRELHRPGKGILIPIDTEAISSDPWKHRSQGMKCRTCMWYVEKQKGYDGPMHVPEEKRQTLGRCRKHAPTMGGYPVVFQNDWCGDHKLNELAV